MITISQRSLLRGRPRLAGRLNNDGSRVKIVFGVENHWEVCITASHYITSLLKEVLDACEPRAAAVGAAASPVWLARATPRETLGGGGAGKRGWEGEDSGIWAGPPPSQSSDGSGTWGRMGGGGPHPPSESPSESPLQSSPV